MIRKISGFILIVVHQNFKVNQLVNYRIVIKMTDINQNEEQLEEIEALNAIYDGDSSFTQVNQNTFQYKLDCEEEPKFAFLLEIKWPEKYPEELPTFNLNQFFNNHISKTAKKEIEKELQAEAEKNIGSASSFSLIEWARESVQEIIKTYGEEKVSCGIAGADSDDDEAAKEHVEQGSSKNKEKKEVLTKRQKQREWDRSNHKGEKLRGWNWIDVVGHLSKTGSNE